MKIALFAAAAAVCVSVAKSETQGFKDWLVGCDNANACTALGIPREDGQPIAYVKVTRPAGADGAVRASVVAMSESSEGDFTLRIAIDGQPFGAGDFKATTAFAYARVDLDEADSAAFVAALVNARALTLQVYEGTLAEAAVEVSLEGSSAALRYIDAAQKRDGGVTALVARGDAPASAVPPAPAYSVVRARKITELDPVPRPPAALPKTSDEGCLQTGIAPIAFDLGGGQTLWGVCVMTGAYNFTYEFYSANSGGTVTKVPLTTPGVRAIEGLESALTNPYLSENGLVLSAFAKSRGIGDCGDAQGWAWDGTAMRPLSYSVMNECRGVSSDDWITLYSATRN